MRLTLLLLAAALSACYAKYDKAYAPDSDIDSFDRYESETFEQVWAPRDVDLTRYYRVIIDPVTVNYDRNFDIQKQDRRKVEEIQVYFREQLIVAMAEGGYPAVQVKGADVLRLVPRFQQLEMSSSAGLISFERGHAAMEMEYRDSVTNELLMAISDRYDGRSVFTSMSGLGDAKEACRSWARRFREHLDQVHGKREGDLPGRPERHPTPPKSDPEPAPEPEPEAEPEAGATAEAPAEDATQGFENAPSTSLPKAEAGEGSAEEKGGD